jgi:predicted anti-sigma-YlaC factor YlaD
VNAVKNGHLTGDEIARAVVSEAELPASRRAHLAACPACRGEKENIEKDLTRLRGTAQRFAPSAGRRIVLAEERDAHPVRFIGGWRMAAGMALAMLSVVAFIWWYTTTGDPGNVITLVAENGYYTDPEMVEVSLIVENPLPQAYLAIAGETVVVEE